MGIDGGANPCSGIYQSSSFFGSSVSPNPAEKVAAVGKIGKLARKNANKAVHYRHNRQLPKDEYGNNILDIDRPHTQIGTKKGEMETILKRGNGDMIQTESLCQKEILIL